MLPVEGMRAGVLCVTWLIPMCDSDMIHFYIWPDSFLCVREMCERDDLFLYVTWLIPMWDMTRLNHAENAVEIREGIHECVMSYIWMWVMSHIWMCYVTHINASCHIGVSHIPHMNESWHRYKISSRGKWNWNSGGPSWRNSTCDMTHCCVWHDSFLCGTWLICITQKIKLKFAKTTS